MSVVASYIKDPSAILDYSLDWGSWLQSNETISGATWAITPSQTAQTGDLAVKMSAVAGGVTTAWLQNGVVGCQYTASCTITTSLGRTDVRSISIDVEDR
jgi:hypothetical protein